MERLSQRLGMADKTIESMNEILQLPAIGTIERDALIQRFEYSFETAWKAVKRYLAVVEGTDISSPKSVIRASLENRLLNESQTRLALQMADDRNLTSHTYNEALAQEIASRIPQYADLLSDWISAGGRCNCGCCLRGGG